MYLSLGFCGLIGTDLIKIADALGNNRTLSSLYLSGNQGLDDESVEAISGALITNNTLQLLDLSEMNISENGFKVLAESLLANTSLQTVRLPFNTSDWSGPEWIRLQLDIKPSIKLDWIELGASMCCIDEDFPTDEDDSYYDQYSDGEQD